MPLFGPPDVEKLQAKGNTKGLIKALSYQKSEDVRQKAAAALGQIVARDAVEPLIQALEDNQQIVCQSAATALGQIADPRVVGPLVYVLGAKQQEARLAAARALGRVASAKTVSFDASAIEALVARLADSDPNVRQAASQALGAVGAPAVARLAIALADRERVDLAAKTLIQIGAPAIQPLLTVLEDRRATLRQTAATALGQIGARPDVNLDEKVFASLKRALDDASPSVRWLAARALDKMGWQPDSEDTAVRYWIAQEHWSKCIKMGPTAIKPLITAMNSKASKQSQEAARALGQIGGAQAVEALVMALQNGSQSLRQAAADALDQQNWEPSDPKSAAAYWVAREKWDRCAEIGEPAVEVVIAVLHDKSAARRQAAAETLGRIGDTQAVTPLLALLKDKTRDVALATTAALGEIGDRRAVAPLLDLLKSPVIDIKLAAISALGRIGDPTAVGLLTNSLALRHGSKPVREAAAQALLDLCHAGALSQAQMVSSLVTILEHADKPLRRTAATELVTLYHSGKLGDEQKQAVFKQQESIAHHTDQHQHSDFENAKGCFHWDESVHTDTGAGIEFVL